MTEAVQEAPRSVRDLQVEGLVITDHRPSSSGRIRGDRLRPDHSAASQLDGSRELTRTGSYSGHRLEARCYNFLLAPC